MEAQKAIEQAVRLARAAAQLPDDVEERLDAMGLDPTLRDQTLLLIEKTRLLTERADEHAGDSRRLRGLAAGHVAPRDHEEPLTTAVREERMASREATAEARDQTLTRRELTADARDGTLAEREETSRERERGLDDRQRAADLTDQSLQLREQAVAARATALDVRAGSRATEEFDGPSPALLAAAVQRGWRAALQTVEDAGSGPLDSSVVDEIVAELMGVVPALVEEAMHRWVRHAHHELRQPIAVISGVAETLQEHHHRLDPATLDTLVARMRRQVLLLQQVLDQLERATRLRTGRLEVQPHRADLRTLVHQLRSDHGPLLGGVTISYAPPPHAVLACVDPAAVVQILLVLLRNAADHAPSEKPLLLETIPGVHHVRVSIHDAGAGVPFAERERIFEYGTRLNGAGSLGLGLFIARGLARAHGGDLTVGDSHLGGARFDLTLPVDCPKVTGR